MLHQFVTAEPKKRPADPKQYLQPIKSNLQNRLQTIKLKKLKLVNMSKILAKNLGDNRTKQWNQRNQRNQKLGASVMKELENLIDNMDEIVLWLSEMESLLKNLNDLDLFQQVVLLNTIKPMESTIATLSNKQLLKEIVTRADVLINKLVNLNDNSDTDNDDNSDTDNDDNSDTDSNDDRKGSTKTVSRTRDIIWDDSGSNDDDNGSSKQSPSSLGGGGSGNNFFNSPILSSVDPMVPLGHTLHSMPNSPQGSSKRPSSSQGSSKRPSSPRGSSKRPSSPQVSSKRSSSPSLSDIWQYQDNDAEYKDYNATTSKQINDEVLKGNFNKNNHNSTTTFSISVLDNDDPTYTHKFDIYLDDENNGNQIGNLNARHIRRKGIDTIRPTTPSSQSPKTSKTSTRTGNAQQRFQIEIWQQGVSRADWFKQKLITQNITGHWEYNIGQNNWPYEMTHNCPRAFSATDIQEIGFNPRSLWEYSNLHFADPNAFDARKHVSSNKVGQIHEFVGFFRLTGNRCGIPAGGLVTHTLQNVRRLKGQDQYGDALKMNVLYHATKKDTAVAILASKFQGSYSKIGVYGKGTYFAMGPYVDYTMGNSVHGNSYASWGGNDTDGYAYIIASHAVTRPSKVTLDHSMDNGFGGDDSKNYVTGGNVGSVQGNNGVLSLRNREIVYGDRYNKDNKDSSCPVEELIFPIGIAVFKL